MPSKARDRRGIFDTALFCTSSTKIGNFGNLTVLMCCSGNVSCALMDLENKVMMQDHANARWPYQVLVNTRPTICEMSPTDGLYVVGAGINSHFLLDDGLSSE